VCWGRLQHGTAVCMCSACTGRRLHGRCAVVSPRWLPLLVAVAARLRRLVAMMCLGGVLVLIVPPLQDLNLRSPPIGVVQTGQLDCVQSPGVHQRTVDDSGSGIAPCSLLPAPCSLLPAPFSLLPSSLSSLPPRPLSTIPPSPSTSPLSPLAPCVVPGVPRCPGCMRCTCAAGRSAAFRTCWTTCSSRCSRCRRTRRATPPWPRS
jgi:hypothetical protein